MGNEGMVADIGMIVRDDERGFAMGQTSSKLYAGQKTEPTQLLILINRFLLPDLEAFGALRLELVRVRGRHGRRCVAGTTVFPPVRRCVSSNCRLGVGGLLEGGFSC